MEDKSFETYNEELEAALAEDDEMRLEMSNAIKSKSKNAILAIIRKVLGYVSHKIVNLILKSQGIIF